MKKDILNELTGLDDETVNEIAENAPELDRAAQERILKKCMEKDMSGEVITVKGTERYKRPRYHSFAAAAAVVVLLGGIGGAFAIGKNMKKAPEESKLGMQQVSEESTEVRDKVENTSAAATEGSTAQTATAPTNAEPASAENTQTTTYGKGETETPDLNELDPDKAEIVWQKPTETTAPENVQSTTYGKGETEKPDLNELDPDKAEIIVEKPTENITEPTEPIVTDNEPNVYLTVLKPITGYWYSNRTPQAQWYFGENGEGNYYDGNTCWGYSFHYTYDMNAGTIEYAAYNADGTLSNTLCGKGTVRFTNNNGFLIKWEDSDEMEGFKPNTADAMEE